MTKRMLIDATHAEETRVVVLDGTRLEDFDVETSTKRQLKGNIYLAKVVRVEPSLQAAFVEYGGNRHGFLAFSEIHPDYYQIPIADRQRLIEMQAEDARREEEEDDLELALSQASDEPPATPDTVADPALETVKEAPPGILAETAGPGLGAAAPETAATDPNDVAETLPSASAAERWAFPSTPPLLATAPIAHATAATDVAEAEPDRAQSQAKPAAAESWAKPGTPRLVAEPVLHSPAIKAAQPLAIAAERISAPTDESDDHESYDSNGESIEVLPPPETVGGGDHENGDDQRERRVPPRFLRNYKIQEVIRRRQILLVQVVKEERGTKGAALTTYLSLAGRFGVLMPNSPRGGGISRKITSAADRRRLKEVMVELDIPRGMGMIVRTAGANRPKPEIKRDCEYLLRLWDDIREHTMKSVAPALIYEEASLIKRAIRDVYSRDIDEILVDGEDGWRAAHDFMRMLMPSHAKKVQFWRDGGQPLFARNQVEAQLDGMLMPTVQLRSGGYLVINQAEALVAIDVNSGRSTRERNIEETALRTNLEAADEVARQLRLRDLAGLIVIDFIDMESKRHNAMVERRIKEALKNDRARIQIGHISHFGLLEMSRQRLRPSLAETSFIPCPHCGGTGHVRSTENAAIHVLRGIEDEGGKRRSAEIIVHVSTPVALYLLNHKRERLREIELRYVMRVIIAADDAQIAPQFRIEKIRTRSPDEFPAVVMPERSMPQMSSPDETAEAEPDVETDPEPEFEAEPEAEAVSSADDDDDTEEDASEQPTADASGSGDEADKRRRRRRRRRGGRRDDVASDAVAASTEEPAEAHVALLGEPVIADAAPAEPSAAEAVAAPQSHEDPQSIDHSNEQPNEVSGDETPEAGEATTSASDEDQRNRRRGRRGGRRRRRENEGELTPMAVPGADQPELPPVYAGPTPADPFGGRAFDIFDVMDQAERAAEARPATPRATSATEIVSQTAIVNETAPEPDPSHADPAPMASAAEQLNLSALQPEPSEPVVPETFETVPQTFGSVISEPSETMLPQASEPVMPEAEIHNSSAPEPVEEALRSQVDAEIPSPPTPANDTDAQMVEPEPPTSEPLIKPILIGAGGEPPAERKRGWWRR